MATPLQPLTGVVVLDLSRYLPGPYVGRILVDLGATVIKVEAPGRGDTLRSVPPWVDGVGAAYAAVNAGKLSVALDTRSEQGQAVLHAMVRQADVLVESFRPGVLDRMGLDAANRDRLNPRLITASLSGYGQDGPLRDRAGHDLNYLARAGVLSLFGPTDRPPQVPAVQIADLAGGTYPAAMGILAALLERQQTGVGRHLDVSLTRGVMAMGTIALTGAAAGSVEPRGGAFLSGGAASYRCYETSDGRYLAVGALEPRFFATFCACISEPDLASAGYSTGEEADRVAARIAAAIAQKSLQHWLAVFGDQDVCVEPVLSPQEAMAANPRVVKPAGAHTVVHVDLGVETPATTPVRALGADNDAACALLCVPADLTAAAFAAGALVSPS